VLTGKDSAYDSDATLVSAVQAHLQRVTESPVNDPMKLPSGRMLAYRDPEFLDNDDARPIRILSEYLAPLAAFRRAGIHDTVVFLGSARLRADGPLGRYYDDACRLARSLTEWACTLPSEKQRFVVCSGGAGGIMEAASRGAAEAGGRPIGLNIGLPHEQRPNPYVPADLSFEFHYFFMRKLWFAHLARAVVVFPGGFGTLDELFEILTLSQTRKLDREIFILLYGSRYWRDVVDFEALARYGSISREDLALIHVADDVETALRVLKEGIRLAGDGTSPAFAESRTAAYPAPSSSSP
jgi:uncharacterized protein (TIGR00730 family)